MKWSIPETSTMNYLAFSVAVLLLIISHHGDVQAAALNKFQSVRFVTDNEASDNYYKSVQRIDKPSLSLADEETQSQLSQSIIADDVFWGELIENAYPRGFQAANYSDWNEYVNGDESHVVQLEQDKCGRMQNRLLIFSDGTMACARYRQNIDQIQGELFSFYLGSLLNLTNMAPTALQIVNEDTSFWANASTGVREAGWKALRPVVLTKHIAHIIPACIPRQFQKPLERHLNKFDVKNITLGLDGMKNSVYEDSRKGEQAQQRIDGNDVAAAEEVVGVRNLLADKSSSKIWPSINWFNIKTSRDENVAHPPLSSLVELAQWSDLVVFDYIIAHLDRVVNNLYNFQWNSAIMEAPAHNLAKNRDLLLFLDNESGLLHGYRLLAKYEAYHSLLLENLCVFRRSTINQVSKRKRGDRGDGRLTDKLVLICFRFCSPATPLQLRWLETQDVGQLLNRMYLDSTPAHLSGILPQLPDKSIVILKKRINQVLRHVDKCQKMFSSRNK